MRPPVIPEGILTFADYFKLNADIEDILGELGYSYRVESCKLPQKELVNGHLGELRQRLEDAFPHVSLTSEAARREFLIAPVLMEAARTAGAKISVEFPLDAGDRLRGTLDYLVRARHKVLVVEAKNGDLKRGFTQLAVELVAFDRWIEDSSELRLYGAVSMGDVWKFAFLDRFEKRITEDLNTYGIPTALEKVLQVLFALLTE